MAILPFLRLSSSPSTEGDYVVFTLELSEAATDAVSVDFQFRSGTGLLATDFNDYGSSPFSGTLTFAPGETVRTIRIYARSDTIDEIDQSVFLELSEPRGARFGDNTHTLVSTGWVLDDDGVGIDRAMAVSNPVVTEEAGGEAVFTLSLSEAFTTDRTFSFTTYDGSAQAGTDYVARSGTVTFLAGQTEATVAIDLINDRLIEAGESFGLAITGAHDVPGVVGTAEVLNDDGAQPVLSVEGDRAPEGDYLTYVVRLSEAATDAVSVDFQFRSGTGLLATDFNDYGSSPFSGTLTFAPGETVRTIRIYARSDTIDETDQSVFLELSEPRGARFGDNTHTLVSTGWVLDDDGVGIDRALAVSNPVVTEEAGGEAVFTLSLSEAFTTDRTFSFTTYDGSALAGTDYVARSGTVTFLAGQTEATVAIDLINDRGIEAGETFGLAITGAHDVPGVVGTAEVLNDDGAQPVLSVEGDRAPEGDYLTYVVRLSEAATDAVSVDFQFRSGTGLLATDFNDYGSSPFSGTLTFAPGETVRTIRIYARSDTIDETDESVFLDLSNLRGASFGGGNRTLSASGWALDDDGVGLNRTVSVGNATVQEGPGGRVAVFVVDLSSASTERIALDYQTLAGTALAGSDFTAAAGQVIFRPGQTRAEIRIAITDDLLLETGESFSLRLVPPFPSQISGASPVPVGVATILDGTLRGSAGNDRLTGTGDAERIEGFSGNDLLLGRGGNDLLAGGAGNDTLDGGAGRDRMEGGAGNDTHIVDTAGDRTIEAVGAGTDTVRSAIGWTLAQNIEQLVLTGAAGVAGTGNGLANTITGNAGANRLQGLGGNDTLDGGGGRDILTGDAGRDTFVFSTAPGSGSLDRITDFSVIDDTIQLENRIFRALSEGTLRGPAFAANTSGQASDATDRIIYERDTGALWYDADGTGGGARVQFATLSAGLSLTAADFFVI